MKYSVVGRELTHFEYMLLISKLMRFLLGSFNIHIYLHVLLD